MRLASPAGMKMGGRSGGRCRASGTRLGLWHRDGARRAVGTDLVSGRSSRNRSTRNQQLTAAFSKESLYEARLTRRDENGWLYSTQVAAPSGAGIGLGRHPGLTPFAMELAAPDGAWPVKRFNEESTPCASIFERGLVWGLSRRNRSSEESTTYGRHFRESPPMRLASPAGMKMGGRSGGRCRASGTRLGLWHRDGARRAVATDLVSGRYGRDRSRRNQQLTGGIFERVPL